MVANSTRELVFEVVDAQQDLTIKFTIFGLIIGYSGLLWWLQKDLPLDTVPKIMFKFFANIYLYATLFFLPLFTIMLFRDYEAINLWTLVLQLYGVVFVITALILVIFGWQKTLEMFGIDVNIKELMQDRPLRGEIK